MLEARSAELEANQFSTTTKLQGQAIISVNAGGFSGDRIIDPAQPPTANPITSQPNPTILFPAGVDLNTSFRGTDLLKIRLDTGTGLNNNPNDAGKDNAAGLLEPNFGSVLDYSVKPPTNGDVEISRLYVLQLSTR